MNPSFDASDDLQSLRGVQIGFLRPLSAIAATRAGAVPQARILRILTDLACPLSVLHGSGRVHGAISCDSIGLDAQGRAAIVLPSLYDPHGARDQALQAGRASGFNAFEQFTDDPAWKIGPWTDVYALCAACFRLVTGTLPPAAIDRCLDDRYVLLSERGVKGYDRRFLSAVDQGLAMRPQDRLASIAQMLVATGMEAGTAHRLCELGGPAPERGMPAAVLPISAFGLTPTATHGAHPPNASPAVTPGNNTPNAAPAATLGNISHNAVPAVVTPATIGAVAATVTTPAAFSATTATSSRVLAAPCLGPDRMKRTENRFSQRTPNAPGERSSATRGATSEQWPLAGEISSWLVSSAWLSWVIVPMAVALALFGVWLVCQRF